MLLILILTGVGGKGAFGQGSARQTPPDTTKIIRDTLAIEEVEISTGYQTIRPERFVGSATVFDSAAFHQRSGVPILERLKGRITGLQVRENTGMQLRGVASLTFSASQPLIVVDNFPMDGRFDINDIHPDDVASITVLKDAAAASVWGALAGNGVIVITTKRGTYNQPITASASVNATTGSKPDLFYIPRVSPRTIVGLEEELFQLGYHRANLSNTTTRPTVSPVVEVLNRLDRHEITAGQARELIDAYSGQDVRHGLHEHLYRRGNGQQYSVAFRGGGGSVNYSLSGGLNRSMPVNRNSGALSRYTLNSQTRFRPHRRLELEAGVSIAYRDDRTAATYPAAPVYPYELLTDADGNPQPTNHRYRMAFLDTVGGGRLLDWHYRMVDEIALTDQRAMNRSANLNFGGTYSINDWLRATVRYQWFGQGSESATFHDPGSYFARDLVNRFTQLGGSGTFYAVPPGGIMDRTQGTSTARHLRGQLDAARRWGDAHRFSAMVAAEFSDARSDEGNHRFYGYDKRLETYDNLVDYRNRQPVLYRVAGTTAFIPAGSGYGTGPVNRRISVLANASYTFAGRYTVYASARRDGANVFGVETNNKWKPLWSVGGSWAVSGEPFFTLPAISRLQLRASYGHMGNTVGGSGLTVIRYNATPDAYTNRRFANVSSPPNPNLRWELIGTFNTGLDFRFAGDRLSGTVDYFRKVSTDVIAAMPFDPSTGVTTFPVNAASLRSNGVEANLRLSVPVGGLRLETALGYSYVRTVVAKLHDRRTRANDFLNSNLNATEGRIAYGLSSYRWAGLDPETGDPRGILNGEPSKDYRGIGNDNINNQVFHGSSVPLSFGNVQLDAHWRGLSLSANFTYGFQYYYRKPTVDYSTLYNHWALHADFDRRWQRPGDELRTDVPSFAYPAALGRDDFYAYSEVNVLRGDHLRLQDLRLQYTLGRKALPGLPVGSVSCFLYANELNVFVWRADGTKYDPDITRNLEYTSFPVPRTLNLGVNLTF